jgi:hypothetical protein
MFKEEHSIFQCPYINLVYSVFDLDSFNEALLRGVWP